MLWKSVLAWIPMVFIAIVNGATRQKVYGPSMNELRAHQVSTLSGMVLFAVYVWGLSFVWWIESAAEAWKVGFLWLAMTVIFEFIFGHYVMKHPWSRLFHDYNILRGRVWLLVLIWTTVLPYLVFKVRS